MRALQGGSPHHARHTCCCSEHADVKSSQNAMHATSRCECGLQLTLSLLCQHLLSHVCWRPRSGSGILKSDACATAAAERQHAVATANAKRQQTLQGRDAAERQLRRGLLLEALRGQGVAEAHIQPTLEQFAAKFFIGTVRAPIRLAVDPAQ